MFVKINRINEKNNEKELIVNLDEIAFLSQAEDHINDEGETEERFVLGFKNGKHPQFLDRANYEQLRDMLLK